MKRVLTRALQLALIAVFIIASYIYVFPLGSMVYYRAYTINPGGTSYGQPLLYFNTIDNWPTDTDYTIDLATTDETDLSGWVAHAFNPVLSKQGAETVVKDAVPIVIGDEIWMYFTVGVSGVQSIWLAKSTDGGINFSRYGEAPRLSATGAGWEKTSVALSTVFDTGVVGSHRYAMLYSGYNGDTLGWQIGYAYSADGQTWTRGDNNPVIALGGSGEWDDYSVAQLSNITKIGNTYYVQYGGKGSSVLYYDTGLVTFTDFEGTYTKSPSNPIITRRISAIQTLTAQTGIGTTTVEVGDTSVFEVNEPVFLDTVAGGIDDEFNRVASITDATHLELTTNAIKTYATGSTIRSWVYGAVTPAYAQYDHDAGTWIALVTSFLPFTPAETTRETTAYATSDDGITWVWDYAKSPPVPYDQVAGTISAENPRVINGGGSIGNNPIVATSVNAIFAIFFGICGLGIYWVILKLVRKRKRNVQD